MFTVGITGGIGSGKSTVCRVFELLGVPVFRSDDEGKRALAEDAEVQRDVLRTFGSALGTDGRLDRKALAAIVFNSPDALARLSAIIHPVVRASFVEWAAERSAPYVINEAAILVETGSYRSLDRLVTVEAPGPLRVARVVARDGSDPEQVASRMRNQTTAAEREAVAHAVIVNDDRTLVIPQVLDLHQRFLNEARQR